MGGNLTFCLLQGRKGGKEEYNCSVASFLSLKLGCLGSSSWLFNCRNGGEGGGGGVVLNYSDEGGSRNNQNPKLVANLKTIEELATQKLNPSTGRKKGSKLRESKSENDFIYTKEERNEWEGGVSDTRGSLRQSAKTKYMNFLQTNA